MSSLMSVTIWSLHWWKLLTLVRLSCQMRCDLTITNPKFNIDWPLENLHQRRWSHQGSCWFLHPDQLG
jgi:hypothetical protein